MHEPSRPLLEVDALHKHFPIHGGVFYRRIATVYAVDGVSFDVIPGETVGLVGESGCGKTTVGRTIMRLYTLTAGTVKFDGQDLAHLDKAGLSRIRRNMQMIFQDPYESLNPRHPVGRILEEPFIVHRFGTAKERRERGKELLQRVGLQAKDVHRFPHEFSGGQRQRVGIARAIALKPKLVICDEPVSALDVSIQSQVLNLLLELQQELKLSYVFIAHDLAIVKHMSDRIAVMYLGRIVELAAAERLHQEPLHPYTRALISAIPVADPGVRRQREMVRGEVPSPINPPAGCRFHTRCPHVQDVCRAEVPELKNYAGPGARQHWVACHFATEI